MTTTLREHFVPGRVYNAWQLVAYCAQDDIDQVARKLRSPAGTLLFRFQLLSPLVLGEPKARGADEVRAKLQAGAPVFPVFVRRWGAGRRIVSGRRRAAAFYAEGLPEVPVFDVWVAGWAR